MYLRVATITHTMTVRDTRPKTTCFPRLIDGKTTGPSEKGETGSGRREKGGTENLFVGGDEFSCQRISPLKALYISLCKPYHAPGRVRARQDGCTVCTFCGCSDQSEAHNSHPLKPVLLSSNRPLWQLQAQQLNWNQVVSLIHKGIRGTKHGVCHTAYTCQYWEYIKQPLPPSQSFIVEPFVTI